MKKILTLITLIITLKANAQQGSYGAGINLGSSLALNKNLKNGFSGSLNFYYNTNNTGRIFLSYTSLTNSVKNVSPQNVLSTNFLTLGYQQYFSTKRTWFANAELGAAFSKKNIYPALGLGLGNSIHFKNGSIDLGLKYFATSNNPLNNMWLQPYIGVKFGLGKKLQK